jgi:hypothetical protein
MFLEGLIHQIGAFAISMNVEPVDVLVRLVLEDGELVLSRGLKTLGPYGQSDWGMLVGIGLHGESGLALRESHVLRAEPEVAPSSGGKIGFLSEAKGPIV